MSDPTVAADLGPGVPDAREFLRQFRSSYAGSLAQAAGPQHGAKVMDPRAQPIESLQLPADMHAALATFKAAHPDESLVLEKYMMLANGAPKLVVEDQRSLPQEDDLVTLSHTTSIASSDGLTIETHLAIGRRVRPGATGGPTPGPSSATQRGPGAPS